MTENIKTFERNTRDKSYETNLDKESKLTETFINWCKVTGLNYKVNPTDTQENCSGCDIEIWSNNDDEPHMLVDLKGCQNKYANICLSYERSYDGRRWFNTVQNRLTTDYIFIDEFNNMYRISKTELLQNMHKFKKVEVSPKTAGHWQRAVLIPKYELKTLTK